MKHHFSKVLIILVIVVLTNTAGAKDDFENAMLKAKKNLNEAMQKNDPSLITKARGQFERILQLKKDPWLVNYYIALADYGLAMTGAATSDAQKIKQYTESGMAILQKSIDEKPDFAESYILMKGLNFNRWQYEQEKMQEILSATQNADAEAGKLEPNNPRYVMLNGVSSYWTPEAFGGGAEKAITDLEKSVELFSKRKESSKLYPDWGKDLAYGYLALSMIKRNADGDMTKAKTLLDEGIKEFPDSGFLSYFVKEEYKKAESKN
jgi:tetratricopeptide (TPR) repeat protein